MKFSYLSFFFFFFFFTFNLFTFHSGHLITKMLVWSYNLGDILLLSVADNHVQYRYCVYRLDQYKVVYYLPLICLNIHSGDL